MRTPGAEGSSLSCPSCGATFSLSVDPAAQYLCGRCDAPVAGPPPGSSDTPRRLRPTYLYGRREGELRAPSADRAARIGRYVLLEEVGRGGMGVVYRARAPDLERDVALKVLLAGTHSARDQVERFLREARAAARLAHPGLVKVHDIGRTPHGVFFTMDIVEGPSLREVIDQRGRLPPREAVRIGAAVARALHAAHTEGLVHRDVKPGNLLLRVDGTPLVADFGLATQLDDDATRLTRSGQVIGTPAYMAPEQTRRAEKVGPATDQYSLAAVLYEALSGQAPYPGESAVEVLYQLIAKPPEPLLSRAPDLPREVGVAIDKAMAREPERRYANCVAFAEDLERILAGEPIAARPPSVATQGRLLLWRHQRLFTIGIGAAVTAALAVQGWVWLTSLSERARVEQREQASALALADVRARADALAADGALDEATRLLESFAGQEPHRGTVAAAQAHLARGVLEARLGEVDDAVAAYAEAYAGATRAEDQDAALRSLARQLQACWRWEALGVVVDTLIARRPGLAADPEVATWRARAALALRDGAAASEAFRAAGASLALAELLTRAEPAPQLRGRLALGDVDADGVVEALVVPSGEARARLVALSPGLPTESVLDLPATLPPPDELHVLPGTPPLAIVRDRATAGIGTARALALEPPRAELLATWPSSRLMTAVRDDLDGDGRAEIFLGIGPYERRLVRIEPQAGWTLHSPHPGTDATESDLVALAVADLDGDGARELVASVGAWGAYDVRVLSPRGARLERTARRKLGFVSSLSVLPAVGGDRLLAVRSDEYPNVEVFPAHSPYGQPAGVYVLSLDRDTLAVERALTLPQQIRPARVRRAVAVDVDGDGRQDVVAEVHDPQRGPALAIWPDGLATDSEPVVLGGLSLTAAAQLDDDSAIELVVAEPGDGPTWVLGAGVASLPALPRTLTTRREIPDLPTATDAVRAAWSRAEDLVGMGLAELAGRRFEDLATVTDAELAAHAWLRAAEIAESLGDDTRASERYERAAAWPSLSTTARLGALRSSVRRHETERAVTLATELLEVQALPDDSRAAVAATLARLAPEQRDARTLTLDLTAGPPPEAELDPLAVRIAGRSGTRVVAVTGEAPVLTLPFRTSGGRLGMTVDLALERVEWAGGLVVELRGPDDTRFGVMARGWGGGGFLDHELACLHPGGTTGTKTAVDGPAIRRTLRLRVDASSATGELRCEIRDGADAVLHRSLTPLAAPVPEGSWTLVVRPSDHGGVGFPMTAEALLTGVELVGGHLEIDAVGEPHPRVAKLARGRWEEALADWPASEAPLARALALVEVGRVDEAEAALAPIASDPDRRPELLALLRSRTAAAGPLQRSMGATFWTLFHQAWGGAVRSHLLDDAVRRALTTSLAGLETAGMDPRAGLTDLRAVALLLDARGRAWASLGEPSAARRDWRAAEQLHRTLRQRLPADEARLLQASRTRASVSLAALEAAEGNTAAALEAARQALDGAAAREVTADVLRARPELARHLQEPAWRALLED